MKIMTNRSLAVAAVLAAAASASAQTYRAQIPMSFHVGEKLLAAGNYEFRMQTTVSGGSEIVVRNPTSRTGAILFAYRGDAAPLSWQTAGNALLAFDCAGTNCALTTLYPGNDAATLSVPVRKLPAAEREKMAALTVPLTKAD
jgi:hypothetical protein